MSAPARLHALMLVDEVRALVDVLTSPAMPSAEAIEWAGLAPVVGVGFRAARACVRATRRACVASVRAGLAAYVGARKAIV